MTTDQKLTAIYAFYLNELDSCIVAQNRVAVIASKGETYIDRVLTAIAVFKRADSSFKLDRQSMLAAIGYARDAQWRDTDGFNRQAVLYARATVHALNIGLAAQKFLGV